MNDAAELIYPTGIAETPGAQSTFLGGLSAADCAKAPLSAKFGHFFNIVNQTETCSIKPIAQNLDRYFEMVEQAQALVFLNSTYSPPAGNNDLLLMTGYMPGSRQGADEGSALVRHPFSGDTENIAKRNYYSVKFVNINSLLNGKGYFDANFFAYLEAGPVTPGQAIINTSKTDTVSQDAGLDAKNVLDPNALSEFGQLVY